MYSQSKRTERLLLLISFLLALLCIAAAICRGAPWELNDDPAFAWLLSRSGNSYAPFSGKLLGLAVHALYAHTIRANWWLIANYACMAFSLAAILFVFYRHADRLRAICLTLILGILFYGAGLRTLNFTRTAALTALGGCLLIADAVFSSEAFSRAWRRYLAGCFLMLLGAQVRSAGAAIALCALAAFSLTQLVWQRFSFSRASLRQWIPKLSLLACAALLFLGSVLLDHALLTPQQKQFLHYNHLRSSIQDYPDRYAQYTAQDGSLSSEDLDVFLSWYSEDTEVFCESVLEKTVSRGSNIQSNAVFSEFLALFSDNRYYAMLWLLLLLLSFFSFLRKRKWLPSLVAACAPFLTASLLFAYLLLKGRLYGRVSDPIFLSTSFFVLYAIHAAACQAPNTSSEKSLCQFCATLLSVLFLLQTVRVLPQYLSDGIHKGNRPWDADSAHSHSALLEAISQRPEDSFFFLPGEVPFSLPLSFGLWGTVPYGYGSNVFYLGGWESRLPVQTEQLAARGIQNPSRALCELESLYATHQPMVTEFLRRHYGEHLTESLNLQLAGTDFVQYTLPIPEADAAPLLPHCDASAAFSYQPQNGEDAWCITVSIRNFSEETRTIYCNLTIHDVRYTYRFHPDSSGCFQAWFYQIPRDFSLQDAQPFFYIKQQSGEYAGISFDFNESIHTARKEVMIK